MKNKKLIFVYNANSGLISGLIDFAHKNLSPNTYECNLCAVTYGNLGMKKEWKDFLRSLDYNLEFLHKDELYKKYPEKNITSFPVVFIQTDKNIEVLIDTESINKAKSVNNLKTLVLNKISVL